MAPHKTSAWPLSLVYLALIVYASLYPFSGWRDQGLAPWAFLTSPWPLYWTVFDLIANVLGYAPLGFLLVLAMLRSGWVGGRNRRAVLLATLAGAVLSFCMEALQSYLPSRVASNLDLVLNTLGTLVGAAVAAGLEVAGAIDHWSRFRQRWFIEDSHGALALLALWPAALLFPPAVPLGLGQVYERVETALTEWLADTPFLEWLPMREVELQPLVPAAELVCVVLGVLVPCLLGYTVLRTRGQRVALAVMTVAVGIAASALSAALSWGPTHAWAWLSLPVRVGLVSGLAMTFLLVPLSRAGCAALALLAMVVQLSLLNQAPASAYFTQTLKAWEQGRFIHFYGVAQWLGWLWPYAALAYVLQWLSRGEGRT